MDQLEFVTPGSKIDPAVAFKGYEYLIPAGRTLPLGVIDLEDVQPINIGGVTRKIASFNDIARREPPDYSTSGEYFKPHNYLSILMNNLGYNKRPVDMNWMSEGIPVENVEKTIPLDFSPTRNALSIKHKKMLLWDLLTVIYFWGRGRIEMGYILDLDKSFKLPPKEEILYKFQNNIEVKLSAAVSVEKVHWCISDIVTRRLHNICPHINKEYFYNCIKDFAGYAKKIWIYNPSPIFVSAIVDPTILLTIIKNSEIEAAKIVNKRYGNYKALRPDYETVQEFMRILYEKLNHLQSIYKKYGAAGFVNMVREYYEDDCSSNIVMNSAINVQPDKEDRMGELTTVEEKRNYVKNTEVNAEVIRDISKYLDMDSLPEFVMKRFSMKDEFGNQISSYSDTYYETMKRLYCLFKQMGIYYPSKLDSTHKWIMSKPFFKSPDAFVLYNQHYREFLLAFPDITWKICDSKTAIKAYKDRYDMDVLLDADELGDSYESEGAKSRIFKDEIPFGDEGKYVKPNVDSNLEVESEEDNKEEDNDYTEVIMDKETLEKILSKKFRVVK